MSKNIGPPIVNNNLLIYYDPANTYSYNGKGNTSVINNLVSPSLNGSLQNISTSFNYFGILSFNGSNSYISGSTPLIGLGTTANISINAWLNLSSLNTSCVFNSWSSTGSGSTNSNVTLIQSVTGQTNLKTATNWTVTLPIGPTTGNTLLAYFGWYNSLGITSITQSGSNANWVSLASTNNGSLYFSVWALNPIPAGTAQTSSIYFNGIARLWNCTFEEVSGLSASSVVDVVSTLSSTDPLFNTGNTSTTTVSNEYWINLWYYNDALGSTATETISSAGSGYTPSTSSAAVITPVNGNNGTSVFNISGMLSAYKIVSSTGVAGGLATDSTAGNNGIANFGYALTFKGTSTQSSSFSTSFGLVQKLGSVFARTASDYKLSASLSVNTWTNLCLVYSGIGVSAYINGQLAAYNSSGAITPNSGITSFAFGTNGLFGNNIELLNGNIGPISIYNTTLSTTQVLQNFNAFRSRFGL